MPNGTDSWGEDDNARRYDEFTRLYPRCYGETSRDLVALACPARDATVLDLACGTGATTAEILSVLGPCGRVLAVDKSPAMLGAAAGAIQDSRVQWIRSGTEDVDQQLRQVDAAVCNSAIWQTDVAATAAAVRRVLTPGGRFVFNVGSGFLDQSDDPNELGDLPGVMRAIAAREYAWTPTVASAPATRARPRLSREVIGRRLDEAEFVVERIEELSYEQSAEVERAWLEVPVFTRNYLPGLPYAERMRVLERAYAQLGPGEARVARWVAFAATAPA